MIYCTLEDAWGKSNNVNYPDSKKEDIALDERPSFSSNKTSCNSNLKSSIECFSNNVTCEMFIEHLNNCPTCYSKIKKNSRLLNNINNMIEENKDIILLLLVGLFIVLFINLITNISSKV
jgi:uncharacterized membrane protein YraQ (UPF0718 family)